jgi:fructosamine-3-kinase
VSPEADAGPQALRAALAGALDAPVEALHSIVGGDLNSAFAAELGDGRRVFVKTAADAARGAFAAEAAGLRWLAEPDVLPVAEPLAVADQPGAPRFLALAWIDAGAATAATHEQLGRGLAALHAAGAPAFGGTRDLVLGPLMLPNDTAPSWAEFYATRRLEPLARLAGERGALPPAAPAALGRLIARLDELAGPAEPPARLHGDLWSGNVMTGDDGRAWLIDPAAYGGHREVDLAMLRLFGSPPQRLFDAYDEVAPLADGHEDRVVLWQVMPLLAHAALFGGGWGESALAALRRCGA